LYLFGKKGIYQFSKNTQVRSFLQENILRNGLDFNQEYFVLSTLTGGCVIIDKKYGKIKFHINYMSGLPDDEINAVVLDRFNALWISHDDGLSSLNPGQQIRDYSPYPGIYGNINDVTLQGDNLYVASDDGIYRLEELTDVKEKEIIVKEKAKYGYKFVPKITYITQSVGYKFMPFAELKDKFKQFYEFEGNVLAVSDYALYEISDSSAVPIVKDIFIHALCTEPDSSALYAASLKGIRLLSYTVDTIDNKNIWQKRQLIENFNEPVYSIVRDGFGNLIFGTDGKAWIAERDSLFYYKDPVEIDFPVKLNENIQVRSENGKIIFTQSAGIFQFDQDKRKIVFDDLHVYNREDFNYIFGNTKTFIKNSGGLYSVSSDEEIPNQHYWNLFPKIKKFYTDSIGNTWIINGKKNIYQINNDTLMPVQDNFKIFISGISDKSDSVYTLDKPVIEYERNAVRIELSAPFRLQPHNTMYHYRVEGLQNFEEWSKWSNDPSVELSFIPAGDYILYVQAKNILGQLSNQEELSFTILKPFWQTDTFYYLTGGGILVLIILFIWFRHIRLKRKNRILEKKVRERTIELQQEKDKTEELLLNILPKETAEELKLNNKVIPQNYETVTVLFTDFKGFTMVAEKLSPEDLVHEIDYCFKEFDKIISKYKIEKIKTIGDAYMCAAGLPKKYKTNAIEAVKAALDIRDFMLEYKALCEKEQKAGFEIRIGLHSGKVVAGVVGIKKYQYDIWGDTVNLAARMESSGEPGKVNVSGETYELIKDKFSCTYRGKVKAKNKGEVDMYFVDSLKEAGITKKK
jgi:class 3 adenylate cyclase